MSCGVSDANFAFHAGRLVEARPGVAVGIRPTPITSALALS